MICSHVVKQASQYVLCISKDVIWITTDYAEIMTKFVKLSDAEQQFCLVPGIHLAVRDVLNNSTVNEEKSEYNNFVEFEQENDHEEGDYNEDGVIAIILQKLFLMI